MTEDEDLTERRQSLGHSFVEQGCECANGPVVTMVVLSLLPINSAPRFEVGRCGFSIGQDE